MHDQARCGVSIVLFEDFELLDVSGPLGWFARFPEMSVTLVGPTVGPIHSSMGVQMVATESYATAEAPDIVLVPGGQGTRRLVDDQGFLGWLADWAKDAALVTSVCTGSALLAAAGLLTGRRATSNKRAFTWASAHGDDIEWVTHARWVHDGNRWTSSGVTAGLDMVAALLSDLFGPQRVELAAQQLEYVPNKDADDDPFALQATENPNRPTHTLAPRPRLVDAFWNLRDDAYDHPQRWAGANAEMLFQKLAESVEQAEERGMSVDRWQDVAEHLIAWRKTASDA